MSRRWEGTSPRIALALALAFGAVAGGVVQAEPAGAAGNPGSFFDGRIKYSSITNCISIIQANPYTEYGAGAYVGMYTDVDETPPVPNVNTPEYMHVVVYGLGNSCSGQRFVPAIDLPANMSFDTNYDILCYTANGRASSLSDCPQWGNVQNAGWQAGAKAYYSTDSNNANTWPLPQGKFWEFRFPVKSTTTQSGSELNGYVRMFDGNSSPILNPTSLVYVFADGGGGAAQVMYDAPSTYASPLTPGPGPVATLYGIVSQASIYTGGVAGNLFLRRTNGGDTYDPQTIYVPVDTSSSSWLLWTDWDEALVDPLQPNTTYKWRAGFDPGAIGDGGGGEVLGAQQTFKSLASPTCAGQAITVGLQFGQLPTQGNDVIMGTTGVDNIDGDAGNDTICGAGGNDTIIGGAGNDRIDGGAGVDTVSYTGTSAALTVSLGNAGAQSTGGAGTDTITTTENLTGGNGADRLAGSSGNNVLSGGAGNDVLGGGSGNDVMSGGAGNDTQNGGSGIDTASYSGNGSAVTVKLNTTSAQNTGGAGTDTITGTENLTGGTRNDRLTGNSANNRLNGGPGTDVCAGGAGTDVGVSCETRSGIP